MCKLKLVKNSNKTDLTDFCNSNSNIPSIDSSTLLGIELPLRSSINLLGFSLDCKLTFVNLVNRVCRQCYIQLRKFYSIRNFLGKKQRKELISCFVLSCLDYCNVIYLRLSKKLIRKLQSFQNLAAKFVLGYSRNVSAKHLLKNLHWLPIEQRILFKLLALMFKVDRWMAPIYIENFYQMNTTSARPSRQKLFRIPRCSSDAMRKSFSFQGAERRNELPDYIRNAKIFKKLLKTHLFCQAFWLSTTTFGSGKSG